MQGFLIESNTKNDIFQTNYLGAYWVQQLHSQFDIRGSLHSSDVFSLLIQSLQTMLVPPSLWRISLGNQFPKIRKLKLYKMSEKQNLLQACKYSKSEKKERKSLLNLKLNVTSCMTISVECFSKIFSSHHYQGDHTGAGCHICIIHCHRELWHNKTGRKRKICTRKITG